MRALEAAACGCLLLEGAGSAETATLLRDGRECVFYGDRDLEERIDFYLTHEEERRALAEAARARASGFTFEALWQPALAALEADGPALQERVGLRPRPDADEALLARTWEAVSAHDGADPALAADLLAALAWRSGEADLHNALGLTLTLLGQGGGPATAALARVAANHFSDAVRGDPSHPVAALNLVEALVGIGQDQLATEGARRALATLGREQGLAPGTLDAVHFPPGFDLFRVEWERAAWDHPGDPSGEARAKRDLLRWRLHAVLAEQTGELSHAYEAALARPDLPSTRAALGCALGRGNQPLAALEHLRVAAEANPFDPGTARALCQALTDSGDEPAARRLCRDRRLLAAAAPVLVAAEDWFTQAPPPGDELASLVILCCNEVAVTRLCLESVLRHTRPPYELILVDNGSTDETPVYMEEIRCRSQPPHPQPLAPEAGARGARAEPPHPQPLAPETGARGARAEPPHPQPLAPETGARGARAEPPHPQPLAPETGARGARAEPPHPQPLAPETGARGARAEPPHPQPLAPETGARGVRAEPPHPQPLSPEAGARGVRAEPPHPQPLAPETGARGARAEPPHPQPLAPETGARGARAEPPHPQPLAPETGARGARAEPPHPQPLAPETGARGVRNGPARVVVLTNAENKGFAAGCNQALAVAQGDYLVLLNNDTVVTPGWLDHLVAWSLYDWPRVGLVGPVSNGAPAPQFVPPGYESLAGLDAFAARRRQDYAAQGQWCERLTGFCLLVRRAVLEKVGALDEQFAVGFFEDDDLCLRARDAGFRLLVALDTYIHHFGSQTFKGLGISTEEALRQNFARFQQKWGAERTAGYRLPGAPRHDTVPAPSGAQAAPSLPPERLFPGRTGRTVTLCMIVKNEQENLPDCLRSVLDLVDSAVLNDTGSTDRTREIAARFGPKVKIVSTTWPDSFAEARNESLRHATGDWIFWMDADDRLDEPNREQARALFASLRNENAAFVMKCRCLPDPASGVVTEVDHVRLFRNHPSMHWEYAVHEQILPAVRRLGGEVRTSDVVITHIGYQDPAVRARKQQRDLGLLQKELARRPDDAFCLFNLGMVLHEQGHWAQALPVLRQSLVHSHPGDSIVRKLYSLIASCHKALGQPNEALAAFRQGRQHCPGDSELLFWEAKLLSDLGSWDEARACCLELLSTPASPHFASVDPDLRGYKGRHLLAVLYYRQGQLDLARAQWGQVLGERPDFLPAWLGLGEAALARGDPGGLEEAARHLEALPGGAREADLLRGRGLAARGDFAAARELLGRLIGAVPRDVEARMALSRLLLQEARDLEAAERSLHDVLLLEPAHGEAQARLAELLRRKKRTEDAVFEAKGNVLGWVLGERYQAACLTPSDINEHLPTLHALAKECPHVTELGTRTGVSTLAFLWAQPKKLVCYDLVRYAEVDHLQAMAGQTEFVFHQEDVLAAELEETDLLFIDTWHVYQQLKAELRRHAARARRYIVLHDTTTYAAQGETAGHQGLWAAVEEFLAEGTFRLKQRQENNNGLTILERIAE